MTALPPLDLHAHIEPSIKTEDLDGLDAVVFAVTRSLEEARIALARDDRTTVWGVGCHPGLVSSHAGFTTDGFAELVERSAFVGEIGIDGKSRVPLDRQRETLRSALEILLTMPRLVSLHTASATAAMIEELEATPVRGAILHWWLGDETLTTRGVELGCYFSVNAAGIARRRSLLDSIPLDRLLTETDHPFGDRRTRPQRPGNVTPAEHAIASHHNISVEQTRRLMWHNLKNLIRQTRSGRLLPRAIRVIIASLPTQIAM